MDETPIVVTPPSVYAPERDVRARVIVPDGSPVKRLIGYQRRWVRVAEDRKEIARA